MRSLALAAVAVVAPFVGSVSFEAAIAIAMVIVQSVDAVVGALVRDRFKTIGPAVTLSSAPARSSGCSGNSRGRLWA